MKCDTIAIPKAIRAELDAVADTAFRWTPEMDAILRAYAGRVSANKLSDVLTRNFRHVCRSAVTTRIAKLGLNKEAPCLHT